jgi:hypothetical protein
VVIKKKTRLTATFYTTPRDRRPKNIQIQQRSELAALDFTGGIYLRAAASCRLVLHMHEGGLILRDNRGVDSEVRENWETHFI